MATTNGPAVRSVGAAGSGEAETVANAFSLQLVPPANDGHRSPRPTSRLVRSCTEAVLRCGTNSIAVEGKNISLLSVELGQGMEAWAVCEGRVRIGSRNGRTWRGREQRQENWGTVAQREIN